MIISAKEARKKVVQSKHSKQFDIMMAKIIKRADLGHDYTFTYTKLTNHTINQLAYLGYKIEHLKRKDKKEQWIIRW